MTARSEQPISERSGAVLDMLRSVRDGTAEWPAVAPKLTQYKFVQPPPPPVPSTTDPGWWAAVDAYDASDTPNSWAEFEAASNSGLITRDQYREAYEARYGPIPPFVSANGPTVDFGDSDELDDDAVSAGPATTAIGSDPTVTPSITELIGRVKIDATDPLGSLCGLAVLAQSLGPPISDEELLSVIKRNDITEPDAFNIVKAAMAAARVRQAPSIEHNRN